MNDSNVNIVKAYINYHPNSLFERGKVILLIRTFVEEHFILFSFKPFSNVLVFTLTHVSLK